MGLLFLPMTPESKQLARLERRHKHARLVLRRGDLLRRFRRDFRHAVEGYAASRLPPVGALLRLASCSRVLPAPVFFGLQRGKRENEK